MTHEDYYDKCTAVFSDALMVTLLTGTPTICVTVWAVLRLHFNDTGYITSSNFSSNPCVYKAQPSVSEQRDLNDGLFCLVGFIIISVLVRATSSLDHHLLAKPLFHQVPWLGYITLFMNYPLLRESCEDHAEFLLKCTPLLLQMLGYKWEHCPLVGDQRTSCDFHHGRPICSIIFQQLHNWNLVKWQLF